MEHAENWEYIAWDVRPERFGFVLGELNRTQWVITGSEEVDERRRPVADDGAGRRAGWQRIYARRRVSASMPFD